MSYSALYSCCMYRSKVNDFTTCGVIHGGKPAYTRSHATRVPHLQKSTLSSAINKPAPITAEQTNETNASSLTILGVFLCLLVIALIVVTIGWILTYWTVKKKLSQKAR